MISKYKNFILYVLLGGIGALTDLLLYSFLVNIEINYQLANFIGYFLGGIVSFTLNKTYNFKVKNNTLHRFSKYFMVAFIGYIISVLILFLLVDIFKVDIIVSKIPLSELFVKNITLCFPGSSKNFKQLFHD